MVRDITTEDFLRIKLPLADVRSPGEFARGHIPGAVNIPLFTDEERAHVGTVYKQVSPEKAMETGLRYVEPKLENFISRAEEVAKDRVIAVHCWRGGMRSREFAGHLSDNGFKEVFVISGGYKAFRNHLLSFFNTPFHLRMIGGYTGSGKTEILHCLKDMGHQVVDLEGLARHKGSSFGSLGQGEQPSTEQFENDLFTFFNGLDLSKPVWLEDESHNIGGVNIPVNLYTQMKNNLLFFLDIPREKRAVYLVNTYARFDPDALASALHRISKRLGGVQYKTALKFLEEKKFLELALVVLNYYDKTYRNGLRLHQQEKIVTLVCDSTDPWGNAGQIILRYETTPEY